MNPLLFADFYKIHHFRMYPENMTLLYSNFTPRKSRIKDINSVVVFGVQHFVKTYLIDYFNENFFGNDDKSSRKTDKHFKSDLFDEYKRHCNVDTTHIEALWDLGYLPIEIKCLPEGTLCPIGVPMLTIKNTHPDFGWLVNYLETLLSAMLWQPIISATIAFQYRKILDKYAVQTTKSNKEVQWQGHDFSMRGMSSIESAILSGIGHLLSFTGTDTIPAIYQLEKSYNATGLIGGSVPATEHSVMCMGVKEKELHTFERLLDLYPDGILSIVSDTWDLWKVCTEFLPKLKDKILSRNGRIVIRPDSGDPADIICGLDSSDKYTYPSGDSAYAHYPTSKCDEDIKGVIELLWDVFGGTEVEGTDGKMYKVLDPHIGCIYGDGIGLHNLENICERLMWKGFASTNVVFGFGSYGYQYNTRDTFGFAMKATYGELDVESFNTPESLEPSNHTESREIFKDPITDDGTKRSKKGLLKVCYDGSMETYVRLGKPADGEIKPIIVKDQQTWEEEKQGLLKTVFLDGKLVKEQSLDDIRSRLLS